MYKHRDKVDEPQNSSIFYIKKAQSLHKIPKSDQFSGQVARSKVAYPNFAPLDVSPSIVNYSTFEPFGINFLFLVALCYELNC